MHGHELPAQLPLLRDRLVYHSSKMAIDFNLSLKSEGNAFASEGSGHDDNDSGILSAADRFDGPSVGISLEDLTLDVLIVSLTAGWVNECP